MWLLIILFIILFFVFVGYIIFRAFMLKRIVRMDVLPNMPLIENDYRKEFTEGYTRGIVKRQIKNKNGTTTIEFYPMDVEQGENIPRPTLQAVVVSNENLKQFARGKISPYREIIKTTTKNPLLIPEELRKEEEGKWTLKEGQKAWVLDTFGKFIQSGDEAMSELINESSRTGLAKGTISQIKDFNAQFRKIREVEQEQEVKKP